MTEFNDADLLARQHASQRSFYRSLESGAAGNHLIEWEGVQAIAMPSLPGFSIFNAVVYDDPLSLERALPELATEFERAGVVAWRVWVPPGDEAATTLLEQAGHKLDSTPMLMAAMIDQIESVEFEGLDIDPEPTWAKLARLNDLAWEVPPPFSMAPGVADCHEAASHLYIARVDGEPAAGLVAHEAGGDCYFWFVATDPADRRRGLATKLFGLAIEQARERGCTTTSLEASKLGEPIYDSLGYRSFGRFGMWELRRA